MRWSVQIPLCVCVLKNEEKKQKKYSQNVWKCFLLILIPWGGWGRFSRSWWGIKDEDHKSNGRTLIYDLVQPFVQYNTLDRPSKHWLYTNKISNHIPRLCLCNERLPASALQTRVLLPVSRRGTQHRGQSWVTLLKEKERAILLDWWLHWLEACTKVKWGRVLGHFFSENNATP